jgi:hypothetical protein
VKSPTTRSLPRCSYVGDGSTRFSLGYARARPAHPRGREEETEKPVGLFVRREQAERFLEDVRADEPELAERLRPVELDD